MSKHWAQSKTMIFNAVVAVVGALEVADLSVLPDTYEGYAITVIGIVGLILRTVTGKELKAR